MENEKKETKGRKSMPDKYKKKSKPVYATIEEWDSIKALAEKEEMPVSFYMVCKSLNKI